MKLSHLVRSSLALVVFMAGAFSHAHASVAVPEIDPSMAVGGLALLGGLVLVVRGRRRS